MKKTIVVGYFSHCKKAFDNNPIVDKINGRGSGDDGGRGGQGWVNVGGNDSSSHGRDTTLVVVVAVAVVVMTD